MTLGKGHTACAIGDALIERGRSVLFRTAYQLQAADLPFFRWT